MVMTFLAEEKVGNLVSGADADLAALLFKAEASDAVQGASNSPRASLEESCTPVSPIILSL